MLQPEKYISCLHIRKFLIAYSRFRCSSHRLEIEQGRQNGTLLENRICKLCEADGEIIIEDEYHFLLNCPRYDGLREIYIPKEYMENKSYNTFIILMSTECEQTIKSVASFIVAAINQRNKYLEELNT